VILRGCPARDKISVENSRIKVTKSRRDGIFISNTYAQIKVPNVFELNAAEFVITPQGVDKPYAPEEANVMLLEASEFSIER
jgi:hypothetical protein